MRRASFAVYIVELVIISILWSDYLLSDDDCHVKIIETFRSLRNHFSYLQIMSASNLISLKQSHVITSSYCLPIVKLSTYVYMRK